MILFILKCYLFYFLIFFILQGFILEEYYLMVQSWLELQQVQSQTQSKRRSILID